MATLGKAMLDKVHFKLGKVNLNKVMLDKVVVHFDNFINSVNFTTMVFVDLMEEMIQFNIRLIVN